MFCERAARRGRGRQQFNREPHTTRPPPHEQEKHNALPAAAFEQLRTALLTHPLRDRASLLDRKNFGLTTGFAVAFNTAGVKVLMDSPLFARLYPYFNRVRLPYANAWVLNLLHSPPAPAGDTGITAGLHADNTLGCLLPPDVGVVSHQTDVLYVGVPHDMAGVCVCVC